MKQITGGRLCLTVCFVLTGRANLFSDVMPIKLQSSQQRCVEVACIRADTADARIAC